MLCPICKVELRPMERAGIEIDYCPQCRGVWLDRGELDKVIERSASQQGYGSGAGYGPGDRSYSRRDDDDDDSEHGRRGRRRGGLLGDIFDFG
jgi:uncharacterized protein